MAVEVIGGHEEARLIFGAIRASVVLDPAPAVCFDLGGGSLEIMVGDARGMQWATSLPLGVARLTAELVHSDPLSKRDRRALHDRIVEELAPASRAGRRPSRRSSRSGAAARSSASRRWSAARRDEDVAVDAEPAHHHPRRARAPAQGDPRLERGRAAPHGRARRPPRRPHRRRLDVPRHRDGGVRARGADHPRVGAARGHRARRRRPPRPGGLVRRPARHPSRGGAEPRPPVQLAGGALPPGRGAVARALRRDCRSSTGSGPTTASCSSTPRSSTTSASTSSNAGHHRHAAYLVRNGQLRGFAPDEIELLAAMVRWHRRGDPRVSDEFPLLDADAIARVRVLTALLRVADGLDRGRKQTVYGARRDGHAVARAAPPPHAWRRRARGLGRPPQARAVREGLRPRAGAHHPPRVPQCARRGTSTPRRTRRSGMRAIPIGDEWVDDNDELVVRSPFDGHEIDRVPACDAKRSIARLRRPTAVHREGTLPAWKRAEILDRAAQLLVGAHRGVRPHHRRGGGQADQDRPRRSAARGVDVHVRGGRGARARGRDGADGRVRRRRGEARVHAPRADRRRRRDQPVQLPAEPRRPQGRTGDRRRLPGGAEAGVADAALCHRARPAAAHGVRAPARAPQHRHRERGARSATRSSTTTTSR